MIGLFKLLARLRKEYHVTLSVQKDWTALRKKDQKDLIAQFKTIDEKEKLASKTGQEYNAKAERSRAVLLILNKMITQGFDASGAGMTKMLKMFGKYISEGTTALTIADKYRSKMNGLKDTLATIGFNERQLLNYKEKQDILDAKSRGASKDDLDAITAYYDKLKEILDKKERIKKADEDKAKAEKQTAKDTALLLKNLKDESKQREIATKEAFKAMEKLDNLTEEYNKKLSDLGKDSIQKLEDQRTAALKLAGAYKPAIDAITAYYDKLEEKEAYKEFLDNFKEVSDYILNFIDAFDTIFSNNIKNQIAGINDELNTTLTALEKKEKAEVDAIRGTDRERLVLAIATAKKEESLNDTESNRKRVKEAQDALAVYDIKKKYKDKEDKLKKDAANKTAQLQYKVDMAAWESNILKAAANAAVSMLKVISDQIGRASCRERV